MYHRCINIGGGPMAWKPTGEPTVRQQRGRWVVRIDGIDTTSGRRRPRQLGTHPSRRAAERAAREAAASGNAPGERNSVGWLVNRWVASRTDVNPKTRQQYEWAAGHIARGLGGVRLEQLDREDVARWLEGLAAGGELSRRSIQIFRMVLRASLADAVEEGELRRNVAARVPMPRVVARPAREREAEAWEADEIAAFLDVASEHRWGAAFRLAVLYGLRRSEVLGLRWSEVDFEQGSVSVVAALIEVHGRPVWTEGKNARSRRTIPLDLDTCRSLRVHRAFQAEERLAAGPDWEDNDMVVATRLGRVVLPRNFDQTLDRLVAKAGVRRLTSHGLRHTAATHMVRHAAGGPRRRRRPRSQPRGVDAHLRPRPPRVRASPHRQDRPAGTSNLTCRGCCAWAGAPPTSFRSAARALLASTQRGFVGKRSGEARWLVRAAVGIWLLVAVAGCSPEIDPSDVPASGEGALLTLDERRLPEGVTVVRTAHAEVTPGFVTLSFHLEWDDGPMSVNIRPLTGSDSGLFDGDGLSVVIWDCPLAASWCR